MKSFHQLYHCAIVLIGLVSCGNYEEFKEDPSALFQGSLTPNGVTFKEVKEQIFDARCAKCHGQDYSNYQNVIENLDGITATIRSDFMPQDGPLSNELKQMLFTWAAAGAPEGEVIVEPIVVEPTFDSLRQTIFASKCIRCHTKGGPAPFFLDERQNLMVYATVFNPFMLDFEFPEEGDFIKRLNSDDPVEQMPPARSGLELLSDEEKEIITEWIRRGLP